MTLVFMLFLRSRAAPCRMEAAASSLAASWVGSRAVLVKPVKPVKPVAKPTKLARRRIEIRRMLVLAKPAKPVARRTEQLHQMVAALVVNSIGGRQVDRSKQRLSGGAVDDRP